MSSQPGLRILLRSEEIARAVNRLAAEISGDYRDKNPLLIGILKGSFVFMADLIRHLDCPAEVDFICLSSYEEGCESSGTIEVVQDLRTDITGRHVLVVDDIVDTGLTTNFVKDHLTRRNPSSLRICALTDKPSRRLVPIHIDYLGFSVPDKFIVGYGLDWNQQYRHLPGIYFLEDEAPDKK